MTYRGSVTLLLFIVLAASGFAQTAKLTKARQYMTDLSFVPAIALLKQVVEKEGNTDAKILLAECYRKIRDWENAEFWYAQVVRSPKVSHLHKLYYGEALQRNGKCDAAKEWYTQFAREVPGDIRAKYLVRACEYENELLTRNATMYEVKRMDFNSPFDDFSPTIYHDQVIFASDRHNGSTARREHARTSHQFTDLYVVDAKRSAGNQGYHFTYGKPGKFTTKVNTKYNDAAVSFSPDDQEIFFTRNNYMAGKAGRDGDGVILLKVYAAKATGNGSWGEITELPFNSNDYNVAHPALSPDGNKIYFSSNMPGGYGGMDLYVSDRKDGKWSPPVNLGPKINTEGLEVFPFVDKSGRLYFSSDGHVGLGGLDIYVTVLAKNGEWGEVVNAGFPLNSKNDDFGVTASEDGKFGYFTSNRPGGAGGDDLYSFSKMALPASVYVFDSATRLPVENVELFDSCTGKIYTTGSDGMVRFDMKLDVSCTFRAEGQGFLPNSAEGSSSGQVASVNVEIPLVKTRKIVLGGVVFDQVKNLPLAGAEVVVSNTCMKKDITLISDDSGRFEMSMEHDCCYKIKAARKDYISSSKDSICTAGLAIDSTFRTELYIQPILFQTEKSGQSPHSYTKFKGEGDEANRNLEKKKKNKYKRAAEQLGTEDAVYTGDMSPYGYTIGPFSWNSRMGIYEGKGGKPASGSFNNFVFESGNVVRSSLFATGPVQTPNQPTRYLLHIYYDFDQSFLREEAIPELEKLRSLMKDNPTYVIEIASHTDARGSIAYNNRLSQRRAEAVVSWLVDHGVEQERMVPVGYGELVNVNKCLDFVPCSEQEHQMNRRTEFRILGCDGCTDSPVISNPNKNTRVDKCIGCPF